MKHPINEYRQIYIFVTTSKCMFNPLTREEFYQKLNELNHSNDRYAILSNQIGAQIVHPTNQVIIPTNEKAFLIQTTDRRVTDKTRHETPYDAYQAVNIANHGIILTATFPEKTTLSELKRAAYLAHSDARGESLPREKNNIDRLAEALFRDVYRVE